MNGVNLFSDANISNIFSGGPLLPGHTVLKQFYTNQAIKPKCYDPKVHAYVL